jgi:hypothetical protein
MLKLKTVVACLLKFFVSHRSECESPCRSLLGREPVIKSNVDALELHVGAGEDVSRSPTRLVRMKDRPKVGLLADQFAWFATSDRPAVYFDVDLSAQYQPARLRNFITMAYDLPRPLLDEGPKVMPR